MNRNHFSILTIALIFNACSHSPEHTSTAYATSSPSKETPTKTLDLPPVKISSDSLAKLNDTAFVNIKDVSDKIIVDIRYATKNNFTDEKMYDCGECYMRAAVARALMLGEAELEKQNLRFKMFDCYRPRPFQQRLWDKVPDARYVSPPWKGSMHGRGAALDLTIAQSNGDELDMGTPFDYFGEKAYPGYTKLPKKVLQNRILLRDLMEKCDFRGIRTEWWHFSLEGKSFNLSSWTWPCK